MYKLCRSEIGNPWSRAVALQPKNFELTAQH